MAVSEDDVRNIALLARVGIERTDVTALVDQLNGILAHMDVLQSVDIGDALDATVAQGMQLRPDENTPVPLARDRAAFAPEFRDGFFLVPRLATHGQGVVAEAEDEG